MEILNKVDRDDLESLLENTGQNEMSEEMKSFAEALPEIKTIEDLKFLDEKYYSMFSYEKNAGGMRMNLASSEIFEKKLYRGCSDIGLSIAPILRYKKVPTIYVDTARLNWIKNMSANTDGHIFLEVFLDNKWYLYDPTRHLVYDNYNPDNYSLPNDYYVFAKGLNAWQLGIADSYEQRHYLKERFNDFDITEYKDPEYDAYSVKAEQKRKER